ncbi:hypothetical protein Bealeia1_00201 [Candidatus Bealeia paramacronuclearis]|uniref:Uncharacterized protein n=1 Tax=Candidatus Bealeia paramacronuclearis TaxID=1921001 RepID=A0ABZ2C2Z9_9PROT
MVLSPTMISWPDADDKVRTLYFDGTYGNLTFQQANGSLETALQFLHIAFPEVPIKSQFLIEAQDQQFATYPGAVFKSWIHDHELRSLQEKREEIR